MTFSDKTAIDEFEKLLSDVFRKNFKVVQLKPKKTASQEQTEPETGKAFGFVPAYNLWISDFGAVVQLALAGVTQKNIRIEYSDHFLIVSGSRDLPALAVEGYRGITDGDFRIEVDVRPESDQITVCVDKIQARMENGVLSIQVPYVEASSPLTIPVEFAA